MSFWTADKRRYALEFLMRNGLSLYGAAGLVSRWANVESVAAGPTAINPKSKAFGIAQWLGARLIPIRGNTNFDGQLNYVVYELRSSEGRAGSVLRSAQSAQEGARGASMYERAEGYNTATGIDNWTARTAAGIPAIVNLLQPGAQPVNPQNPLTQGQGQGGQGQDALTENNNGDGTIDGSLAPVVLLAASALAVYLLFFR